MVQRPTIPHLKALMVVFIILGGQGCGTSKNLSKPISAEKFAFLHSVDLACPWLCYVLVLLKYKYTLSELSNELLWVFVPLIFWENWKNIPKNGGQKSRITDTLYMAVYIGSVYGNCMGLLRWTKIRKKLFNNSSNDFFKCFLLS